MTEATDQQEAQDPLRRRQTLTLPREHIDKARQSLIEDFINKNSFPGFRQGKVPESVVRTRYGERLDGDAAEKAAREMLKEHMDASMNDPILGHPQVTLQTKLDEEGIPDESGDYQIQIEYDLMPELPVVDIATLLVKRPVIELTDQDVEEELRKECKDLADYSEPVPDRLVEHSDQVIVAPVSPGGGTENDQRMLRLRVDSERVPENLRSALIGRKAGDAIDVESTDGKVTTLQIREVRTLVFAEPSDELAQKQGLDNLEQLRERVRVFAERVVQGLERCLLHCRIANAAAERLEFGIPQTFLRTLAREQAKAVNPSWANLAAKHESASEQEGAGQPEPEIIGSLLDRSVKHFRVALWAHGFRERIGLTATQADQIRAYAGWFRPSSEYAMQAGAISQSLQENQEYAVRSYRVALSHLTVEALLERVALEDDPMTLEQARAAVRREEQEFCGADYALEILPAGIDMPRLSPFGGL